MTRTRTVEQKAKAAAAQRAKRAKAAAGPKEKPVKVSEARTAAKAAAAPAGPVIVTGHYAGGNLAFRSEHATAEAAMAEVEAYRAGGAHEVVEVRVHGPEGTEPERHRVG